MNPGIIQHVTCRRVSSHLVWPDLIREYHLAHEQGRLKVAEVVRIGFPFRAYEFP